MKKQFNLALGFLLVAVMSVGTSFAQSDYVAATSAETNARKVTGSSFSANIKVDRLFSKNFPTATRVFWKNSGDDVIANFNVDDRMAVAWFSRAGKLICVNYYGTGKHLPKSENALIHQVYPEYEVNATVEINKRNITAYVITLHSCYNMKKVKMIDGEIEEMESVELAK